MPLENDKNSDVLGTVQKHVIVAAKSVAANPDLEAALYMLGASTAQPAEGQDNQRRATRHYRVGGTKLITVPQALNMKAAVEYAELIGIPLVAHFIFHWVGTDALNDPTGELFAKVREGFARWLRRRGLPFAGVWCREKLSGGQAEVEHAHLILHLPAEWLVGAKLIDRSGGVEGGAELQQADAALHRIVAQYAGRTNDYAVKLKVPTDKGDPGPYNGRSYDGLYLLKGGGPKVWKLFPRIRKEWRKPQGIIFGKRCGVTQNIGPAARLGAYVTGNVIQFRGPHEVPQANVTSQQFWTDRLRRYSAELESSSDAERREVLERKVGIARKHLGQGLNQEAG